MLTAKSWRSTLSTRSSGSRRPARRARARAARARPARPASRSGNGNGHGTIAADGPAFSAAPDPQDPLYGAKILIVDDDVRNVFALTSVFERCGAEVLYAENGREGIEALERNEDVRLVLMDIMMPELAGYATTEAIRNMPQFAATGRRPSRPGPPTTSPSRSTPAICWPSCATAWNGRPRGDGPKELLR